MQTDEYRHMLQGEAHAYSLPGFRKSVSVRGCVFVRTKTVLCHRPRSLLSDGPFTHVLKLNRCWSYSVVGGGITVRASSWNAELGSG